MLCFEGGVMREAIGPAQPSTRGDVGCCLFLMWKKATRQQKPISHAFTCKINNDKELKGKRVHWKESTSKGMGYRRRHTKENRPSFIHRYTFWAPAACKTAADIGFFHWRRSAGTRNGKWYSSRRPGILQP